MINLYTLFEFEYKTEKNAENPDNVRRAFTGEADLVYNRICVGHTDVSLMKSRFFLDRFFRLR